MMTRHVLPKGNGLQLKSHVCNYQITLSHFCICEGKT